LDVKSCEKTRNFKNFNSFQKYPKKMNLDDENRNSKKEPIIIFVVQTMNMIS
jgi:hypothetical protein